MFLWIGSCGLLWSWQFLWRMKCGNIHICWMLLYLYIHMQSNWFQACHVKVMYVTQQIFLLPLIKMLYHVQLSHKLQMHKVQIRNKPVIANVCGEFYLYILGESNWFINNHSQRQVWYITPQDSWWIYLSELPVSNMIGYPYIRPPLDNEWGS